MAAYALLELLAIGHLVTERSEDFNFDLFVLKEFAVPIALRTNGNGVTLMDLVSNTLGIVVEVLQIHFNHP